jgi:hypothetical protein
MHVRLFARALTLAAAALATVAGAQTVTSPQGAWRSAFDGYQAFADPAPGSWRDVNDTVGRIGGWRAYAREAAAADGRSGDAVTPPAAPAPPPTLGKPAAGQAAPPAAPAQPGAHHH